MNEVVELVADALADGTIGVNAQLTAMAAASLIRSGDTVTPIADVLDETRDNSAALKRPPKPVDSDPVLIVACMPLTPEGEAKPAAVVRDGVARLLIRYRCADIDSADGIRQAYYTMRAVMRVLHDFNRSAEAARTLRGICLFVGRTIEIGRVEAQRDDQQASIGLVAEWKYRDVAP